MNRSFAWRAFVWCFLTVGVLSSTETALDDEVLSYEHELFGEQDSRPGSGLQMTEFENETVTISVNASVVNETILVNVSLSFCTVILPCVDALVVMQVTELGLPACSDDELLTFDGTAFNCSKIRELIVSMASHACC